LLCKVVSPEKHAEAENSQALARLVEKESMEAHGEKVKGFDRRLKLSQESVMDQQAGLKAEYNTTQRIKRPKVTSPPSAAHHSESWERISIVQRWVRGNGKRESKALSTRSSFPSKGTVWVKGRGLAFAFALPLKPPISTDSCAVQGCEEAKSTTPRSPAGFVCLVWFEWGVGGGLPSYLFLVPLAAGSSKVTKIAQKPFAPSKPKRAPGFWDWLHGCVGGGDEVPPLSLSLSLLFEISLLAAS